MFPVMFMTIFNNYILFILSPSFIGLTLVTIINRWKAKVSFVPFSFFFCLNCLIFWCTFLLQFHFVIRVFIFVQKELSDFRFFKFLERNIFKKFRRYVIVSIITKHNRTIILLIPDTPSNCL